jgi:spore coat polysaccharide biosynthesis protein SpsF
MNVVAIIQARICSTRLPGKVLMDLLGEPMLARVVARTLRAEKIDDVVVATTTESADDSLAELCKARGWKSFRGSQDDVLDRFYRAARFFGSDVIVRITSDCPLIDAGVIDQAVRGFLDGNVDYCCNFLPAHTYPRGLEVEVFSFASLARAWQEDKNPSWREHVTEYILHNPGRFAVVGVGVGRDLSAHRWTVDTAEDFLFVTRVYDHFGHDRFTWTDVLDFVADRPDLAAINKHVKQKVVV